MLVEDFHDLGEVGERPGQSVDFIDDDHVDLAGAHIRQKPLERGPLHGRAGEAAVVIQLAARPSPRASGWR